MIPRATLDDIDEAVIRQLIDEGFRENRTLDFKEALDLSKDGKQALAEDVCAFANTVGGDVVIGVREAGGVAQDIVPINVADLDHELQKLTNFLRDTLEPRVASAVLHHVVPLERGGHVVVLRVAMSTNAPHRVLRNNHFYLRNSVGKETMDIHAIRTAFAFADSLSDRALAWREHRLAAIRANQTPQSLRGGARFVVQVLPLRALTHRSALPTAALKAAGELLRESRPCGHIMQTVDVNYEGVVCASHAGGSAMPPQSAYAQVFRDGSLELVGVTDIRQIGRPPIEVIAPSQFEIPLVEHGLPAMLGGLAALDTPAPAYLFVALLDVWNRRIGFQEPDSAWPDSREIPSHLKELLSEPVYIEDLGKPARELAREALAPLWHAIGMERSQTQIGGSLL